MKSNPNGGNFAGTLEITDNVDNREPLNAYTIPSSWDNSQITVIWNRQKVISNDYRNFNGKTKTITYRAPGSTQIIGFWIAY